MLSHSPYLHVNKGRVFYRFYGWLSIFWPVQKARPGNNGQIKFLTLKFWFEVIFSSRNTWEMLGNPAPFLDWRKHWFNLQGNLNFFSRSVNSTLLAKKKKKKKKKNGLTNMVLSVNKTAHQSTTTTNKYRNLNQIKNTKSSMDEQPRIFHNFQTKWLVFPILPSASFSSCTKATPVAPRWNILLVSELGRSFWRIAWCLHHPSWDESTWSRWDTGWYHTLAAGLEVGSRWIKQS